MQRFYYRNASGNISGNFSYGNLSRVMLIQGDDSATIRVKVAEARSARIPIVYISKDGIPPKVAEKLRLLNVREVVIEPSAEMDEAAVRRALGNMTVTVSTINRSQKALEQISEAGTKIAKAQELLNTTAATGNVTLAARNMLVLAKQEFSLAKDSFDAGNYGQAFGQATAAEQHAEASMRIFRRYLVGWYRSEVDRIGLEIRDKGLSRVRDDLEKKDADLKIECEKKVVNGTLQRVCTVERERERAELVDKFEVEAEVGTVASWVKVELDFLTNSTNRTVINQEILRRLNVTRGQLSNVLGLENATRSMRPELEIKIRPKSDRTRVEFEHTFSLNAITREAIINGTLAKLSSLTIAQLQNVTGGAKENRTNTSKEAEKEDVEIEGFKFDPANLTVNVGDTVVWTNKDSVAHTATSTSAPTGGAFDSGNMNPGAVYNRTFTVAGNYSYYCSLHPNMTGKIVVR